MLRKYKKQSVPQWQRRLLLLLGSLFGTTLLLFAVWAVFLLNDETAIDRCLDEGGSFDYALGSCDFVNDHKGPQ